MRWNGFLHLFCPFQKSELGNLTDFHIDNRPHTHHSQRIIACTTRLCSRRYFWLHLLLLTFRTCQLCKACRCRRSGGNKAFDWLEERIGLLSRDSVLLGSVRSTSQESCQFGRLYWDWRCWSVTDHISYVRNSLLASKKTSRWSSLALGSPSCGETSSIDDVTGLAR